MAHTFTRLSQQQQKSNSSKIKWFKKNGFTERMQSKPMANFTFLHNVYKFVKLAGP